MRTLPDVDHFMLVRTGYGSDRAWQSLLSTLTLDDDVECPIEVVDDVSFKNAPVAQLEEAHPRVGSGWHVIYLADDEALLGPHHRVLVVRVGSTVDIPFRCDVELLHQVNEDLYNVSLDWDDVASSVAGIDSVELSLSSEDSATRENTPTVGPDEATLESLRISWPPRLWEIIYGDMEHLALGVTGESDLSIVKTAERVKSELDKVQRGDPDHTVAALLPTRTWIFIQQRSSKLHRTFSDDYDDLGVDGKEYGRIADMISSAMSAAER